MRADWSVHREDGVTLVGVTLAADPPRRVRVSAVGDGPVWPPRSRGVPASGWDESGWEGVVDGRRALGFATPAAADPPVAVEWGDAADGSPGFDRHPDVPATEPTADGAVRVLGPTGPPRDAVPVPDPEPDGDDAAGPTGTADATAGREPPRVGAVGRVRADGGSPATDGGTDTEAARTDGAGSRSATGDGAAPGTTSGTAPSAGQSPADGDGFAAVERRVAAGEALTAADGLEDLSTAVAAVDGLEGVRSLRARLAEDRERLRATEERAARLRERLSAVDLPVERLERLA